MKERYVAITGATGFIGRHIIKALKGSKYTAIVISRDKRAARLLVPDNIEIRQADITDAAQLVEAFQGVEAAIHLAGKISVNKCDDREVHTVNVEGARNFLAAAQKAKLQRVVFTSTTSAVAALLEDNPLAACDENAIFNLAHEPVAYIQAKRKAHELAINARSQGMPLVVISPSFVLGPEDLNLNTTALIEAVRRRKLPLCPKGGLNPIDVRDVANAYVAALEHNNPEPHYILASPHNLTLKDFIGRVAKLANVAPPRLSLPNSFVFSMATCIETLFPKGTVTAGGARLGSYYWYFNAALARRDLSLKCRSLDETLKDTLEWLKEREMETPHKNKLEQK